MDFIETSDRKSIVVKPSNSREATYLREKFPGTMPSPDGFTIPSNISVVYNIYTRLKKKYPNVRVTPFVRELLQSDFKLKEIPKDFHFFTEPLKHQMIALRYLYTIGGGGLLLDPGLGKTKVALDFIALLNNGRALVVCPASLLFVWEDEAVIHRPDKKVHVVTTTDFKEEVAKGLLESDIVVVNYEKAVILQEAFVKYSWGSIFVDEALIKNPYSQRTKALLYIRSRIPVRVIMSGTLITQSHLDSYSPLKFLCPELVGSSFSKFRDTYVSRFRIKKADGKEIYLSGAPKHLEEVRAVLKSYCIVMTKDEWLKLPPKKWFPIKVCLPDAQREKYYELAHNYIAQIGGNIVEADSPLTLLGKLIQIVNGFVYIREPDILSELTEGKPTKGKRETYFFQDQPKIDWIRNALGNSLKDRKIVIWFNMEGEYELLRNLMEEVGISYLSVKGGNKKTGETIRTFNKDPSVKILLAQAKAINYGATLLGKKEGEDPSENIAKFNYLSDSVFTHIFYSRSFSLEVFLQQQDRSHRIGLKVSPEYYILMSNSPIEQKIDEALFEKKVIKESVLIDIINDLRSKELDDNLV